VKVLFLHDGDIRTAVGGAEITQKMVFQNPPPGVETAYASFWDVTVPLLDAADKLVIGNMHCTQFDELLRAMDCIEQTTTPIVKSEHDFMLCGAGSQVDCVTMQSATEYSVGDCPGPCYDSPLATLARRLFACTEMVRYLSPLQEQIFRHYGYDNPSFLAAPYIDLSVFKPTVPWEERPGEAMVVGDHHRGIDLAEERAKSDGMRVDHIVGKERTPEELADVYNQHKYLYLYPRVLHTYCRQAVEAHACGTKVVSSFRVGALSYGNYEAALGASKTGIQDFWDNVAP
jgi:hypothetical protein